MTVSEHRDLVAALLALDGVADAAVETNGQEPGPGTLRLQLAPGADEVAVAGAVNRLLRSRFGLAVDADRVRVLEESAPVPPGDGREVGPNGSAPEPGSGETPAASSEPQLVQELPAVRVSRPGRVTIKRVQLVSAGLGVAVTVTLGLEDREFHGSAEGAATTSGMHRSVATATVRAVEAVLPGRVKVEVEHVEIAASAGERTALVVLTLLTDRGSERLSGASVVREDLRQAVIRATLAALNRRIEAMIGR